MKRVVIFALVMACGSASSVRAGDSLLKAGTRHVQQLVESGAAADVGAAAGGATARRAGFARTEASAAVQDAPRTLQGSGIRKRTKVLIALGMAAGLAGSVYAIDGRVENNTPSTLGTRRD